MINNIDKALRYWRTNGTIALAKRVLSKLSSDSAPQVVTKVLQKNHAAEQDNKVSNILNNRFESTTPLRVYSLPSLNSNIRINLVTDSIGSSSLFGGVGTALIFSVILANKLNAQLRIITRTERPAPSNLQSILTLYDISLDKEVQFVFAAFYDHSYQMDITDKDLFLTTSWWTTAATLPSVPDKSIIYLLQEDERMFYPFSDERFRCDKILRSNNIQIVVNTKLLFDHLLDSGLSDLCHRGMWFEPAFPNQVFRPQKKNNSEKHKFFYYARPNNPRNLFYLGIEVIEQAIMQGIINVEDWDIYFVGKDFPDIVFSNGYTPIRSENLTWAEYAQLISTVDLGLSLMYTPHPSYPPLDLAASGAVVVTNRFANKVDLSRYSSNIICADLNPEALIRAIRDAMCLALDTHKREQNYNNNGLLSDWNIAFSEVINKFRGEF